MKFTADDLIQIYLDGSFTPEAQSEFDRLMRKDPFFAERVTRAVAERLGPVPDPTVDAIAAGLDGKIGGLWEKNKPSSLSRSLRWGGKIALGLAALSGLYFGVPFLVARFASPPGSVMENSKGSQAGILKKNRSISFSISAKGIKPSSIDNKVMPGSAGRDSGTAPLSVSAPGALKSLPVSTRASEAFTLPAGSFLKNVPSAGTTMEGDSLRVDIDTDSAQNVTVTVYDANGLPVRHLFNGLLDAGEHSLDWDGKDDSGNAVSPGDYAVILDRGGQKMSGFLKVLPSR